MSVPTPLVFLYVPTKPCRSAGVIGDQVYAGAGAVPRSLWRSSPVAYMPRQGPRRGGRGGHHWAGRRRRGSPEPEPVSRSRRVGTVAVARPAPPRPLEAAMRLVTDGPKHRDAALTPPMHGPRDGRACRSASRWSSYGGFARSSLR